MRVLLILNEEQNRRLKVMVNVHTKSLKDKVVSLLEANKDREAFDLLVKKAEVETYLAPGQEPDVKPAVTLVEADLR